MRVQSDDETARIEAEWLGPPGIDLPWRARFSMYGYGIVIFIALLYTERKLGIPLSFYLLGGTLAATICLTRLLGRAVTFETPAAALRKIFSHELRAPRSADCGPRTITTRPCRVTFTQEKSNRARSLTARVHRSRS